MVRKSGKNREKSELSHTKSVLTLHPPLQKLFILHIYHQYPLDETKKKIEYQRLSDLDFLPSNVVRVLGIASNLEMSKIKIELNFLIL